MTQQPVRCGLCGLEPDDTGRCPDCGQDLSPLLHLAAQPALHYNRALQQLTAGDDDGAVASLRLALAQDATFVQAWMVLGKVHARNGRTEEAKEAWERALAVQPGLPAAEDALDALAAVVETQVFPVVESPAVVATAGGTDASAEQVEPGPRRRRLRWLVVVAGAAVLLAAVLLAGLLARPGAPPEPLVVAAPPVVVPVLTIATRGSDVILGGTAGGPEAVRSYATSAAASAGDRRLVDTMVAGDGGPVAPGPSPGVVGAVVGLLVDSPPGDRLVVLTGSQAVLSGAVADEGARRALVDGLRQGLAGIPVEDRLVVDPSSVVGDVERLNATLLAIQEASPILFGAQDRPITAQGRATVALVAEYLRRDPRFRVRVEGHAALIAGGDPISAQSVSEVRAGVVRDLLVAEGVDPARVDAVGLGEMHPLDTAEASRRAEISVVG